jgi:NAD(P)-dependent dehydrogenase (short-subunit alcohol dehydrogenase family)
MAGRLDGQTVWISGATSGIGRGAAELFLREGAKVAMVDIDAARGVPLEKELAALGPVRFIQCDVSNEAQVRVSIDETVRHFGGLQTIVNNAGIVHVKKLHEYSEQEWDRLMGVNVKSIFFSTKHGLAHLKKHARSYIVNLGSISSFVGQSSTPAYTASKGAVLQLTRSIALDYAVDGVRCNCVCPGITDTPMFRAHVDKTPDPSATLAQRLRRVPMNQALTPNDIARAIRYFACEDSAGVTGTSLVVDCGYIATAEWDAAIERR